MTLTEFKTYVQSDFPIPFDELITRESVDGVLNNVITKALTKFEKVESIETAVPIVLTRALCVMKVTPTHYRGTNLDPLAYDYSAKWSLADFFSAKDTGQRRMNYYFATDTKMLSVESGSSSSIYVEYIIDPKYLTVADLTPTFLDWCKRYACVMLMIKEGYAGTRVNLNSLPFDFGYAGMKDDAVGVKADLETELNDMNFGCFFGK